MTNEHVHSEAPWHNTGNTRKFLGELCIPTVEFAVHLCGNYNVQFRQRKVLCSNPISFMKLRLPIITPISHIEFYLSTHFQIECVFIDVETILDSNKFYRRQQDHMLFLEGKLRPCKLFFCAISFKKFDVPKLLRQYYVIYSMTAGVNMISRLQCGQEL